MGFFDRFRSKKEVPPTVVETEQTNQEIELVNMAMRDLFEETKVPSLRLTVKKSPTTLYSSKLGGRPYLPPNFEYPRDLTKGGNHLPLKLLAQLNFEELKGLPQWPQTGILQFYILTDDLSGLDLENACSQERFRIVYHADIITDESRLQDPPVFEDEEEDYFPVSGEFLLESELEYQGMGMGDFRFDERFKEVCGRYFPGLEKVTDLSDTQYNEIADRDDGGGHRIGGYPIFTQVDPREDAALSNHTVLLFQCDSDGEFTMWGDSGVANFFIEPERLATLDFSNVAYNWDCY